MAVSPDPDISLVPGVDELQHAICKLTATEKNIITDVLQRDEEVRLQEEQRLRFVLPICVVPHHFACSSRLFDSTFCLVYIDISISISL